MPKSIDLTGQQFGYLRVLERCENTKQGKAQWVCECKCGTIKKIRSADLRGGQSKSCGCKKKEQNRRIDLTGQHFGYFKVLEYFGNSKQGEAQWLCECVCGQIKIEPGSKLRNGEIKSCGCKQAELAGAKIRKHGMKGTRLYNIWQGMKFRTSNDKSHEYKWYGERGIKVCKEWEDFESFKRWAEDNGYTENLEIDRIDNDKGYCPENCRWVTTKENQRNKRNNHLLAYKGDTKTITEWSEITGLNKATIRYRVVKMGWNVEKALTTPVKTQTSQKKQP